MALAMETEEEMIELGNLSNYIVESIFSKIPLKSLTQLKTVSKTWRNSITNIRHCYPRTTSSGLVLFLKHRDFQESIFMKLHDQKGSSCMGSSEKFCTFGSSYRHKFSYLIDSCNGVLLYGSHDNEFWTYSISVLDQVVTLPVSHNVIRPACSSLVFDGWHDDKFQIMCFFWEEVDVDSQLMNCMMFSSNLWSWREDKLRIMNSELLLLDGFSRGQCCNTSVFVMQKLYWIWSLCLLVYDIDEEYFTLFPLPNNSSRKSRKGVYSQMLWESSEGLVQFCDPVNNGFFIWSFNGGDFKLDHYVRLEDLRLTKMGYSVKPCAFNKDLEVLYLHVLPHTIVSYSFETRELVQVWSYIGEEEEDCWIFKILPFLFSSVDLLAFNKLRQVD
ncbi:hypothetical protein CQW23_32046 [Capsicum baccatum]|uniref:F-box domain-containing protein n=1 Tax=Capsicum baccatum TaxID=33114 RepID=A0A2G2V5Z0_CAPBA|nr:hypothetical protein CQW23_32046 [Capsicum baccatum]